MQLEILQTFTKINKIRTIRVQSISFFKEITLKVPSFLNITIIYPGELQFQFKSNKNT